MYRTERNYENLNKGIFPGAGRFDIPILRPELTTAENWISFNYAKGCEEPSEHGVHFFVDDYQFNRIWAHPDNYLGMMARFDTVCTPDFSTYTDFPRIIQIYNHYRKHWLGAYWQAHGIKVIPTISWSTPDSFAWCFDGEPVGGAVAVSTKSLRFLMMRRSTSTSRTTTFPAAIFWRVLSTRSPLRLGRLHSPIRPKT